MRKLGVVVALEGGFLGTTGIVLQSQRNIRASFGGHFLATDLVYTKEIFVKITNGYAEVYYLSSRVDCVFSWLQTYKSG